MSKKLVESIVKRLSEKYGFNMEEGMRHVVVEKKLWVCERVKIPWCGVIIEGKCNGIRLNHGLYTQCEKDKEKNELCRTCYNQSLKTENKEPPYGLIKERLLKGKDYIDKKGKRPVQYGNVMEKENITREAAERYAASLGMTIAEEDFEVKKGNRGRPKKSTIAIDTSDEEEREPKKGRGRPKKNKEEVAPLEKVRPLEDTRSEKDDPLEESRGLRGDPLEESRGLRGDPLEDTRSEKDDPLEESRGLRGDPLEEEEEEVEVKEFTFNKKLYYRNPINNALYDPKSYEHIGTWDEENKKIIDVNEEDE